MGKMSIFKQTASNEREILQSAVEFLSEFQALFMLEKKTEADRQVQGFLGKVL